MSTHEAVLARGCPQRHAETIADPSAFPEWSAWLLACRRALGTGAFVVLCGERGNGKTQIGTELVRHARSCKEKALYTTALGFFLSLREAFRSGPEAPTEKKAMDPFVTCRLLVIDEIHERGGSEWEDRMLRYVIDARYGAKLDTVVIGNLKPEPLFAQLGTSIRSRFEEIGTLIECTGCNFRKARIGAGGRA